MRAVTTISLIWLLGCTSVQAPDERSGTTASGYPLSHTRDASNLPSKIALCTEDEPGEKMIISGTVYEADGVTPVKDAVVFLYQTDARGVYSEEQENSGRPKLRGYLKTDADGKYEISSIKPGHYPHIKAPAHIHVQVWAPNQPEYPALFQFYDDPLISDERRARSTTQPEEFGLIKLVADDHGVLHGVRNIKTRPATTQDATMRPAVAANTQLEQDLRKIVLDILEDGLHGGTGGVFRRYRAPGFISVVEAGDSGPMHPLETRTIEIEDVRLREDGDTVIMAFRRVDRIELKNQKFTKSERESVVFLRRDGNWRILSDHSSPIGFERAIATVEPKILDAYIGTYENPLWGIYYVTREGNELAFTSANGYRTEYLPESETEFFNKDEQGRQEMLQTITFVRGAENKVSHCVFRENDGQNIVVTKLR